MGNSTVQRAVRWLREAAIHALLRASVAIRQAPASSRVVVLTLADEEGKALRREAIHNVACLELRGAHIVAVDLWGRESFYRSDRVLELAHRELPGLDLSDPLTLYAGQAAA